MTLCELQVLVRARIEAGEFGAAEFAALLCSRVENPLQVILTDRKSRISSIIDADRDDGTAYAADELMQPWRPYRAMSQPMM